MPASRWQGLRPRKCRRALPGGGPCRPHSALWRWPVPGWFGPVRRWPRRWPSAHSRYGCDRTAGFPWPFRGPGFAGPRSAGLPRAAGPPPSGCRYRPPPENDGRAPNRHCTRWHLVCPTSPPLAAPGRWSARGPGSMTATSRCVHNIVIAPHGDPPWAVMQRPGGPCRGSGLCWIESVARRTLVLSASRGELGAIGMAEDKSPRADKPNARRLPIPPWVIGVVAAMVFLFVVTRNINDGPPDETAATAGHDYRLAVHDAAVIEPEEIKDLPPLRGDSATVVTWTKFPDSYKPGEAVTLDWGEVWVTAEGDLRGGLQGLRGQCPENPGATTAGPAPGGCAALYGDAAGGHRRSVPALRRSGPEPDPLRRRFSQGPGPGALRLVRAPDRRRLCLAPGLSLGPASVIPTTGGPAPTSSGCPSWWFESQPRPESWRGRRRRSIV